MTTSPATHVAGILWRHSGGEKNCLEGCALDLADAGVLHSGIICVIAISAARVVARRPWRVMSIEAGGALSLWRCEVIPGE